MHTIIWSKSSFFIPWRSALSSFWNRIHLSITGLVILMVSESSRYHGIPRSTRPLMKLYFYCIEIQTHLSYTVHHYVSGIERVRYFLFCFIIDLFLSEIINVSSWNKAFSSSEVFADTIKRPFARPFASLHSQRRNTALSKCAFIKHIQSK